jgi:hypothetical protein
MKVADFRQQQAKAMLEDELAVLIRGLAKRLGMLRYHSYDSRKSEPGFPDEVLLGSRALFRELKQQGKNPTVAQQKWLDKLTAAGYDAAVWRPEDWFSGRIEREMRDAIRPLGATLAGSAP